MTIPVEGLDPLKKVSWTMWNLDGDGQIESWLATCTDISVKELLEDIDGEWMTVSGNTPVIDNGWHGSTIHGIGWKVRGSDKPFILYVPNVRHSFVKE